FDRALRAQKPGRQIDLKKRGSGSGAALHDAFGLDRNLRVRRRQPAAQRALLLEAFLLAGDLDVLRVDLLAEAGHLVGTERVRTSDHAAAVLYRHGHLSVRHGGAARVLDEAEIGRALVLAWIVVVPETRSSRPEGG